MGLLSQCRRKIPKNWITRCSTTNGSGGVTNVTSPAASVVIVRATRAKANKPFNHGVAELEVYQ